MKKCIMTQSAVEVIRGESLLAFEMGKESGGLLAGPPPTEEAVVVSFATGPGEQSGKSASSAGWETDPAYLNEMLKTARDENPAVNFRGFWHRHPGLATNPSSQDLSEARKILKDKKHYKLTELVMPIATVTNEKVIIQCYYISSDDAMFREMQMELVSDEEEMVKGLLSGQKVIEVEQEIYPGFWQDEKWQFYRSPYGALRLEEELDGLKDMGYKAEARLLLNDGGCFIEAWRGRGRQRVLFLLPREYPLNPPRVFIKRDKYLQELKPANRSPFWRWTSDFYLVQLLGNLEEQIHKRTKKRNTSSGILLDIEEDSRGVKFGISRLLLNLVKLIMRRWMKNAVGNS